MIPFPFEVVPVGERFTWRIISACGRPLVYTDETYASDFAAAAAAKEARAGMAARAERVDA